MFFYQCKFPSLYFLTLTEYSVLHPLLWKSYGTCFSVIEREFCDHSTRQISCLALKKREGIFKQLLKNLGGPFKKRAPKGEKKGTNNVTLEALISSNLN